MNHNVRDYKRFDVQAIHFMRDQYAGDKLMRNDNGVFKDVSAEAGIKGTPIGFGLGINVSDLNGDNWPDIYISNDYLEGDYLYINQKDGTFSDDIKDHVDHTSYFSMGNDVADINNDALPDIFTSDMLPEDNKRQKLLFGPDNYEGYLSMLRNEFHPEIMRNMLHVNEGNGRYAEIGQLAGISNTDWSWSPLLADYDNDGFKDLFITNGYLRDYTNNDFIKFYSEQRSEGKDNVLEIINKMPSSKVSSYIFRNKGDLTFENMQAKWGISEKNISNGAVYADLDNDGDLEIITNNLNEPASIFKNTLNEKEEPKNYISVKLEGKPAEILNTKIKVRTASGVQFREFSPNHGFQSSYSGPQYFGLGSQSSVESIEVEYPNGQSQTIKNPAINQILEIKYKPSEIPVRGLDNTIFTESSITELMHGQMPLNDFSRQILLPWMYSYQGPCLAKADVNKDGIEDFYMGGGKGFPGKLMLGKPAGGYVSTNEAVLKQWELCTDTDAVFFDSDSDGDLDLYVTGGGYEYLPNDLLLQNRLYLNDGKGNFTKTDDAFPADLFADSCVELIDFDNDGDQDVFVGGSVLPTGYPMFNPSRFYCNDKGHFTSVSPELFSGLGIIKDAVKIDYNEDGLFDLITAGEWTGITVFKNTGKNFDIDHEAISSGSGLWQNLSIGDFDRDGDADLLAGNLGENSQLCASSTEPLSLYVADYDQNGRLDPILSCFIQNKNHPFYSRDEILDQLSPLRKVYNSYESYSDQTIDDVLKNFKDIKPEILKVSDLRTKLFINESGKFVEKPLPVIIQSSPVYAMLPFDVNGDGFLDFIAAGNNWHTRVRLGNISANHGQVYLNDGKGNFSYLPQYKSGISVIGETRSILKVNNDLLFGRNGDYVKSYQLTKSKDHL